MFKRLNFDAWMDFIPILAFLLTFVVFLACATRAVRMRRDQADRLASLPLDGEPKTPNDHE